MNDSPCSPNEENEVPLVLAPFFAPLPTAMMKHLSTIPKKYLRSLYPSLDAPPWQWEHLECEVREKRHAVNTFLLPFLVAQKKRREERYGTGKFLATLQRESPGKKEIPPQTLSYWHQRGLFRYEAFGQPDPASMAALLIARMLDQRRKGWLPSAIDLDDAWWWCFHQDSPDSPILPCPIPLPQDLPVHSILWTPWAGAALNDDWLLIESLGAIRWGKRTPDGLWDMTSEALERWDPGAAKIFSAYPSRYGLNDRRVNRVFLDALATTLLYRIGRDKFVTPKEYYGLQSLI